MSPPTFILAFISCWSVAVVGGYLAVVGLGNVRLMQRGMLVFWDVFLLLLGSLLMIMGMVFLYMLVYG